ncbi:ATP-binding cassette domain-containing protein [Neobacillus notoginsengisoli]|uniref:Carnitine transport ATP-binding protein OpuCA n=1 Tax=Neobacillus notoginsengisoli TaxID=1578198 RepID=A0A417Z085_9BACI|nr:ABC transporter ATP-binding protein [Neobacillus notoginsengisoli]RHW43553.1 ATP-binding cassette domain-containing protein [Neobacillus notoginsengisoli]
MFIQIKDLQYKYKNAKEAVIKDFCLDIERGEIVSILGESGSGKSTILRLIAGLECPQNGTINICGETVCNRSCFIPPEKRGIGFVFQDYALFPHMTVAKNIQFGLKKKSRQDKRERLEEMLKLVNLTDFANRFPHELSGGQQQRVALARALAPEPSLLILDEPFSNLDAALQEKIRGELREIIKKTGITSIFVTHDKEDAIAMADRIVYIDNGKVKTSVGRVEKQRPVLSLVNH